MNQLREIVAITSLSPAHLVVLSVEGSQGRTRQFFPIPDFAWHRTSMDKIACGIHSCCTEKLVLTHEISY